MADRRARIVYRPLDGWPYPPVNQQASPFGAPWPTTTDLLRREADHLRAALVVVELDVPARAIRLDDQLRADTRAASVKVRISMETSRGAMSWHTDRYVLPGRGMLGWRENVRAIALTLQALRAVDRYGAVHSSEQYRGFTAIEAGPASSFATADEALRWVREIGGVATDTPRLAYRNAARRLHPDTGGDPADWARLQQARELIEQAGLW